MKILSVIYEYHIFFRSQRSESTNRPVCISRLTQQYNGCGMCHPTSASSDIAFGVAVRYSNPLPPAGKAINSMTHIQGQRKGNSEDEILPSWFQIKINKQWAIGEKNIIS